MTLFDGAIGSITKRFDQTTTFNDIFGFMYIIGKLQDVPDSEIFKQSHNLLINLMDNENKDINSHELYEEFLIFRHLLDENIPLLQIIFEVKKANAFPNLSIALRIMSTILITSAGAERTFSKLKLIKTYSRSTVSQQRLTGLATICIEIEISVQLDYAEIINYFASRKARKKLFKTSV